MDCHNCGARIDDTDAHSCPECGASLEGSAQQRHAGVRVRIAANLLDLIIMGIPVALLVSLILQTESRREEGGVSLADFYNVPSLLNAAVLTAVTILLWVNWDGRTPGKKLMRIRIVSYPGYQPFSYGTASLRQVVSLTGVLTAGLLYLVMVFMVGLRADKRGFHDLIARTCVIHDR